MKEEQSTQSVKITQSHQDGASKSSLLTLLDKGKTGKKHLVTLPKKWTGYLPINTKQG